VRAQGCSRVKDLFVGSFEILESSESTYLLIWRLNLQHTPAALNARDWVTAVILFLFL
jgi:hypothetical protein